MLLPHNLVARVFIINKQGRIREEFIDDAFSLQTQLHQTTCKILTKNAKIKLVRYYGKTEKNYDYKIETVKYLEAIDQNNIC